MALTVECSCRFNLEFAGIQVPGDFAFTTKLQQLLGTDITRYFANNVGLDSGNVAFNNAISANYDFGSTLDISDDGAIDSEITIAVNVSFQRGAGTYQGRAITAAIGFFWLHVGFVLDACATSCPTTTKASDAYAIVCTLTRVSASGHARVQRTRVLSNYNFNIIAKLFLFVIRPLSSSHMLSRAK